MALLYNEPLHTLNIIKLPTCTRETDGHTLGTSECYYHENSNDRGFKLLNVQAHQTH